jgi:hypothetical protein
MAGSWAIWIIIQDQDDFILTFFSPAFLPGWIIIKILARKYERA